MNPVWLIAVPLAIAFLGVFSGKFSRFYLWIASMFNMIFSLLIFWDSGVKNYVIGGWEAPYGINLILTDHTRLFLLAVNILFFLALISSSEEESKAEKKAIAYILSLAALNGILLTGDMFNLFVFLEIASISAYIMAASGKDRASKFAALKYLIIGTVASSLYLLGTITVYASLGTLNIADAATKISGGILNSDVLLVAALFFLAGLGVESKLFPLNGWVPDVYTHASGRGVTIMASVFPLVMVTAFTRIMTMTGNSKISDLIIILGIATAVVGEILAFSQKSLKRTLAYSSMAQSGLALLLVGLGTKEALIGSAMILVNNGMSKLIMFGVAGFATDNLKSDSFEEIKGLGRRSQLAGFMFSVAALSVAGLPMFFGFRSKLFVVSSTFEKSWIIPAVILITAAIEATYYFRWIFNFFRSENEISRNKLKIRPGLAVAGILLLSAIVILGIGPENIMNVFNKAGTAMFDGIAIIARTLTGGI